MLQAKSVPQKVIVLVQHASSGGQVSLTLCCYEYRSLTHRKCSDTEECHEQLVLHAGRPSGTKQPLHLRTNLFYLLLHTTAFLINCV